MLSTQDRLKLLGGADSKFPLLNSLRRAKYAEKKRQEAREQLGADREHFFPDEYASKGGNRAIGDSQKAGLISLQILKPGTSEPDGSFDGTDVNIAGRLVRPQEGGKIHFLDADLLKAELDTVGENNRFVDRLTGLLMEDESGAICRFVLPKKYYDELNAGAGVGNTRQFNGYPEHFTQYPPQSTQFSEGVAKLKAVVKRAQQSIVFDDHVMGMLKKYEENSTASKKGGCCC